MKHYLRALALSAITIVPLNIVASFTRPHWSIGSEILLLPVFLIIAHFIKEAEENE